MTLNKIKEILQIWKEKEDRLDRGEPSAAVLVPLYTIDETPHVLLTIRKDNLRKHSGQISFPGGKIEKSDQSIIDTALRETTEEVGLPASSIEIITKFDDFMTPYYDCVTPIIGSFSRPGNFTLSQTEIEKILEVPLVDLLDPKIHHTELWRHEGKGYEIHFFNWVAPDLNIHEIWGATADVLHKLVQTIRSYYYDV